VSVGEEVDYATLRQDLVKAVARVCPRRSASGEGNRPLSSSHLYRVACSVLVDEIRRLRRRNETDLEDETVAPVAIARRIRSARRGRRRPVAAFKTASCG
jgi:hypothetical protein